MTGGRSRSRGRSRMLHIDTVKLEENNEDIQSDFSELDALGKKYEKDKATLEAQYEKISNSKISASDKKAMLQMLKSAILQLQEEYEEKVTDESQKLEEDAKAGIEKMQEAAEELKKQEADLQAVKLDAASMDASAAEREAAEKRKQFENMKLSATQQLELKLQQLQEQQRTIRRNNLGGK